MNDTSDLLQTISPRLLKLLKSGKQFIIIGEHESYYMHAYNMIRAQEQKNKTWTPECESMYLTAIDRWREIQIHDF